MKLGKKTFSNVITLHSYTDSSGELVERWFKIGYVKETEDGARYLHLYHSPKMVNMIVPDEQMAGKDMESF